MDEWMDKGTNRRMKRKGRMEITLFIAILGDLPIVLRRQYKVVLPSQNDGF